MTFLDRLLEHDRYTTRCLLEQCRVLDSAEWHIQFDIGHETLRDTFAHMMRNVEIWTDLMCGRDVNISPAPQEPYADTLIERWETAYDDFAALARDIDSTERHDALWLDTLDNPPRAKSYGGAIAHVITHNMHHRAELTHIMTRLGLPDVPEGDVLSWERQARAKNRMPQLTLL